MVNIHDEKIIYPFFHFSLNEWHVKKLVICKHLPKTGFTDYHDLERSNYSSIPEYASVVQNCVSEEMGLNVFIDRCGFWVAIGECSDRNALNSARVRDSAVHQVHEVNSVVELSLVLCFSLGEISSQSEELGDAALHKARDEPLRFLPRCSHTGEVGERLGTGVVLDKAQHVQGIPRGRASRSKSHRNELR